MESPIRWGTGTMVQASNAQPRAGHGPSDPQRDGNLLSAEARARVRYGVHHSKASRIMKKPRCGAKARRGTPLVHNTARCSEHSLKNSDGWITRSERHSANGTRAVGLARGCRQEAACGLREPKSAMRMTRLIKRSLKQTRLLTEAPRPHLR